MRGTKLILLLPGRIMRYLLVMTKYIGLRRRIVPSVHVAPTETKEYITSFCGHLPRYH